RREATIHLSNLMRSTQVLQGLVIPGDQSLLLLSTPALDSPFAVTSFCERGKLFRVNDNHLTPGRRVGADPSFVVHAYPGRQILGMTHVERTVGAPKNVDPGHRDDDGIVWMQ